MVVRGPIGAAVVWLLTTVEDVQNMFSKDAPGEGSITGDSEHRAG